MMLFTFFLLIAAFSFAQTKVVKGKVVDENGIAVPGVTVLQKGSKKGTQTDKDGNFSINVTSGNNDLVFSSVGYSTQDIDISGKPFFTVSL